MINSLTSPADSSSTLAEESTTPASSLAPVKSIVSLSVYREPIVDFSIRIPEPSSAKRTPSPSMSLN